MEEYSQEERYLRAKKRVEKIKGFYSHLVAYVIINVALLILIFKGYNIKVNFWNLGTFSTAIGWGIGLAIHGMVVFGPNIFFGKDWEERKLQEFMKEEESKRNKWE